MHRSDNRKKFRLTDVRRNIKDTVNMECPKCNNQAITFSKWLRGTNAFKTNCSNCNAAIKANATVYILFILTMMLALSLIPFLDEIFNFFELEIASKKLKLLALLPVIFMGGIAAWLMGGYKTSDNT